MQQSAGPTILGFDVMFVGTVLIAIAAAAVFLASSGADMINGADLLVDGGYTIR